MSRRLDIEVETTRRGLETELFETSNLTAHDIQLTLADGTIVTFGETLIRKSFQTSEVIKFAVESMTTIGVGLVTNFLYEKLKGKPAKLRINRIEVEITSDRIRMVIEEIQRES